MRFLKIISFVENVLSVYRNYLFFNKHTRKLILLRIMLELIFIAVNIVDHIITSDGDLITNALFFYLCTANSIFCLLLAIYHSKPYKKLVMYFKSFNLYFPNDIESTKKSEVVQIVLVTTALSYFLLKLTTTLYYFTIMGDGLISLSYLYRLILIINIYCCNFRFIIEFFVMCCGVNAIAEQINVIVFDIDKENLAINSDTGKVKAVCKHASIAVSQNCKRRLRQFDTWSAAYATIKKCSELCNNIFGFQVSVCLGSRY